MGALADNAAEKPLAQGERRASWADSQHRPKHMRWRDKVAYVEHHQRHDSSAEAAAKAVEASDNSTKVPPLAHGERRSSWADTQHRPKHMRWRDKVAYVEHHHSDPKTSTRADRTSEDSCESTGEILDVQTSATHSKTKHSKPHHYSESFTHHPPHITFREKMEFLQGDHKNKDSKHEDQKASHKSWTSRWSARSSSAHQLPPRAGTTSSVKTSRLTSSNNEGISSPSLSFSEKRLLGLPYPALAS